MSKTTTMRKTVPARVTVIAILHFVFGGLGVLQNTVIAVMLAAGINQMFMSGGSVPPGSPDQAIVRDMQKAMVSTPGYDLVQYVNVGVGLLDRHYHDRQWRGLAETSAVGPVSFNHLCVP